MLCYMCLRGARLHIRAGCPPLSLGAPVCLALLTSLVLGVVAEGAGSISNQLPTPLLPRNIPSTANIPQAQIVAEVFP